MTAKQWERRREDLVSQIEALVQEVRELAEEAQEHFDNKSERWQESEKGAAFEEFVDAISDAADELEEFELPEWPS